MTSAAPASIRKAISRLPSATQDVVNQRLKAAQIPVVYLDAVRALAACRSIDEGKYWANKADALAAWAKIFQNKTAAVEAKRLKLFAYRRMGLLAGELQETINSALQSRSGRKPGARRQLAKSGLTHNEANAAVTVARMTEAEFAAEIERNSPRAASTFKRLGMFLGRTGVPVKHSDSYFLIRAKLSVLLAFMRSVEPTAFGASFGSEDVAAIRPAIVELQEWLDAFEQHLPKANAPTVDGART